MKRLISLIVCIVLTVSAFTAAYATESITATNEGIVRNETQQIIQVEPKNDQLTPEEITILRELVGIIQEANTIIGDENGTVLEVIREIMTDELARKKKGKIVQEENGEISQNEYSMTEEVTGNITQAEFGEEALRQMVIQYAKDLYVRYADFIFPSVVIVRDVDQFIALLQTKRASFEASARNEMAQIDLMRRAIEEVPIFIILGLPMILFYGTLYAVEQSLASEYRALIEAKQYYNYKLDGSDVMPIVQKEIAPKKR